MTYTENLQKKLKGFELFILPEYDAYMEEERREDEEYNSGISYYDNEADFYAWVDMMSWEEILKLIEEYRTN
jgi:hypothetical protein